MYDQRLEFVFTVSRALCGNERYSGKIMVKRARGDASVRCKYGVDLFSLRKDFKMGRGSKKPEPCWLLMRGIMFLHCFKLVIDIKNSLAFLPLLNHRRHRHPGHPS
jgi:hypothetical protein